MTKLEIKQLVNNIEHGIRVMESDPNVREYVINNMSIYREANGYSIFIPKTLNCEEEEPDSVRLYCYI